MNVTEVDVPPLNSSEKLSVLPRVPIPLLIKRNARPATIIITEKTLAYLNPLVYLVILGFLAAP